MFDAWQAYLSSTTSIVAPKLLYVLIILTIGSISAVLLGRITKKLVNRLDFLFLYISGATRTEKNLVQLSYATILGKVAFIATFLLTIELCANVIGWNLLTSWINNIARYFPNIVSCILIMLTGFLLAKISKSAIKRASLSIGIEQVDLVASASFFTIALFFFLIGIQQLGINITLLFIFLVVAFAVLLSGLTIAFSLGAKLMVENLLGANVAKKLCRSGENLAIDGISGQVIEIGKTHIVLSTKNGRVAVPTKLLFESKLHIHNGGGDSFE